MSYPFSAQDFMGHITNKQRKSAWLIQVHSLPLYRVCSGLACQTSLMMVSINPLITCTLTTRPTQGCVLLAFSGHCTGESVGCTSDGRKTERTGNKCTPFLLSHITLNNFFVGWCCSISSSHSNSRPPAGELTSYFPLCRTG